MFSFVKDYRKISLPIRNAIAAEFFIQSVNATFMNILPLYMTRKGFADHEIALFITCRFIGVFMFAFPLGRYIRKRPALPLFYISSVCVPLFGIAVIACIAAGFHTAAIVFLLLWGASFTFMQIPILPFILKNCPRTEQTAAISLSYSTWSFGGIASGIVIAILDAINPAIFDEQFVLFFFCLVGFGGIVWLRRIGKFNEIYIEEGHQAESKMKTDWPVVIKALGPTLIIATGAGLTIPFISLFFEKVHDVHKGGFQY
jgi:MFS family permease